MTVAWEENIKMAEKRVFLFKEERQSLKLHKIIPRHGRCSKL